MRAAKPCGFFVSRTHLAIAFAGVYLVVLIASWWSSEVESGYVERPEVRDYIDSLALRHAFDLEWLEGVFADARHREGVIAAVARAAKEEGLAWGEYRESLLAEGRIAEGVAFWNAHAAALERAELEYGVAPAVVVAILGMETDYGGNAGRHRVIDALATLGFDYPPEAPFYREQLTEFLLLAREEGVDAASLMGSHTGAMGLGRFEPSTYRSFAVDFDGDGKRDVWHSRADAIGSVANRLAHHRWRGDAPVAVRVRVDPESSARDAGPSAERTTAQLRAQGVAIPDVVGDAEPAVLHRFEFKDGEQHWVGFHDFQVIARYNRSRMYALAVSELAHTLRDRRQSEERLASAKEPDRCESLHSADTRATLDRCTPRQAGSLASDVPELPSATERQPAPTVAATPTLRRTDNYEVLGKRYQVLPTADGYVAEGVASWYGPGFHGRTTATGEPYSMYGLTAAHTSLPLPSWVRVTNLANGRSSVLRVNDRGPFVGGRIIDLSYAAAVKLGFARAGLAQVRVETVTAQEAASRDDAGMGLGPPPALFVHVGPFAEFDLGASKMREFAAALDVTARVVAFGDAFVVRIGPIDDLDMADVLPALAASREPWWPVALQEPVDTQEPSTHDAPRKLTRMSTLATEFSPAM